MGSWSRLVRAATIGVASSIATGEGVADPSLPEGLRRLLDLAGQRGGEEPGASSSALLRQAAIMHVARRAGYVPQWGGEGIFLPEHPDSIVEPWSANGDRLRECTPAMSARLEMILTDRLHLLPEWLRLLGQAGYRLPNLLLPELLELGLRRPEVGCELAGVLGSRGEWLAALNPEWVGIPVISGRHETPSPAFRAGPGLGQLLGRLISFERRPLGRDTITLYPPPASEEEPIRSFLCDLTAMSSSISDDEEGEPDDGPDEGPDEAGEVLALPDSPSARLLIRLLSRIDPAFWVSEWQVGAETIVSAAARSESRALLLTALTIAVKRFAAVEWAEPLLAERLREPTEEGIGLFRLLPADRQEHWMTVALRQSSSLEADQPAFWLLTRSTIVWSRRVAELLWPLMTREIRHRAVPVIWDWQLLMRKAALHLDPSLAAELAGYFAAESGSGTHLIPELARMIDDIAFRAAMARELGRLQVPSVERNSHV